MASSAAGDTDFQVRKTHEATLEAGEVLFEEGDTGEYLYVIQAGEVELTRGDAEGRRLVGRLGPGEFFGEMSVVLGGERRIRATAVTPLRVIALDGQTLESMCVERPEVAIRLIQRLAGRVIDLETRLSALGSDDLLPPVVRVLLRRAQPGRNGSARIEATLRELSEESGLTLREAHRALHHLFDQKVLRLAEDMLETDDLESISACLDSA
jgi:CRP/FNR family cyclic AMP-dependent transcriptional regulator